MCIQLKHGDLLEMVGKGGMFSRSLPKELSPGLFGGDVLQRTSWDFSISDDSQT